MKKRLEVNAGVGIRLNKNYNSLVVEVDGHDKVIILEKDGRNHVDKMRHLRLPREMYGSFKNIFLKMQGYKSNFFYNMDIDEGGVLENMFYAYIRSRKTYREFGNIVTFDIT